MPNRRDFLKTAAFATLGSGIAVSQALAGESIASTINKAEPYRDVNGDLIFTRVSEEKKMTQTSGSSGKEMSF